ncbi:MAG: DUF692 domain-containing protein [Rickettsiales bacterium]|nr:DUF692 domain-containing protein [Rickettsiales bacterium]
MFGLGLRDLHHKYVLTNNPKVDFFEVHTENFIADGGASLDFLSKINERYDLSFHCVGLSIGSFDGIDKKHLRDIKNLLDRFNPILFSDHLSWSGSKKIGHSNDLLPLPLTQEAFEVFKNNVDEIQQYCGRKILIENPSAYLEFQNKELGEVEFLNKLVDETHCGLLLDINNIYVGAKNFNFDAKQYIDDINFPAIGEIHLAGHSVYEFKGQEIRIDTHSTNICKDVFDLYRYFLKESQMKLPTLVEWDEDIPEFSALFDELVKVKEVVSEIG